MTRDEAVQKLATVGHLSMAHAEDLYDSLFEKPVVPQYVADWIKKCKMFKSFAVSLSFALHPSVWEANGLSGECIEWLMDAENQELFARAWVDGYEVEKEKRYRVSMPNTRNYKNHAQLLCQADGKMFWCGECHTLRTKFTYKELEDANFGWVFDCPGVEVKEVEQMIRTKYLREETDNLNHPGIDKLINDFLAKNPNIEIIDIKYQSNVAVSIYEYGFCRTYDTSALIIYKEN